MQTSTQLKRWAMRRDQKCAAGVDTILFVVQYQGYLAQARFTEIVAKDNYFKAVGEPWLARPFHSGAERGFRWCDSSVTL